MTKTAEHEPKESRLHPAIEAAIREPAAHNVPKRLVCKRWRDELIQPVVSCVLKVNYSTVPSSGASPSTRSG